MHRGKYVVIPTNSVQSEVVWQYTLPGSKRQIQFQPQTMTYKSLRNSG